MKKIIIAVIISLLIISVVSVYLLSQLILPSKIRSLIVSTIENQTHKQVSLKKLEFNIFKGLILNDLVILDGQKVIFSVRQANCAVFILPIFKKQVIIPSLTLVSPYLFLERRKDNSLNIAEFLFQGSTAASSGRQGFNIAVYRVRISSGQLVFQDTTVDGTLRKELNNVEINTRLSLPLSIKFDLKAKLQSAPAANIDIAGEYKISRRQLSVKAKIKNLPPQEAAAYVKHHGLSVSGGNINASFGLELNDKELWSSLLLQASGLAFAKDELEVVANCSANANIHYSLQDKKYSLQGKAQVSNSSISGIEQAGRVDGIEGNFSFDTTGLSSEKVSFRALGMPWNAAISLKDFSSPVLEISSSFELAEAAKMAAQKFNLKFFESGNGQAALLLSMRQAGQKEQGWLMRGSLNIKQAQLKLSSLAEPIQDINARIEFSSDRLQWKETGFTYQGKAYQSAGSLVNFQSPRLQFGLSGEQFSLTSSLNIAASKVMLSSLEANYNNCGLTLSGQLDNSDADKPLVDFKGKVKLDLSRLAQIFPKQSIQIGQSKPAGTLSIGFVLSGNIRDFRNCFLAAGLSAEWLSFYGLKLAGFSADYQQAQGLAEVSGLHFMFYGGSVDALAKMNLASANLPYRLDIRADGIKLEQLKLDTASNKKNISGTVQAEARINGFSNDLSKLSGAGKLAISDGRLWELNLFKGLGSLIFVKDFSSIVFSQGHCTFLIKERNIFSDDLKLESNIANLSGPVRIGFDGSLEAALDVEILDNMVPLSGTLKDITTVIAGEAGKFGVIRLSGTLKEPKYKFQPAMTNIIKGLKDVILGK